MILHLVCQESEGLGPSKLNLWHGTLSRTQAPGQVSSHSAPLSTELANKDLAASQTKWQLGWDLPPLAALTTPAVPQSFLTPKDKLNTKITSYLTLDSLATKRYQFKPLTKILCQSLFSMLRVITDKLELFFLKESLNGKMKEIMQINSFFWADTMELLFRGQSHFTRASEFVRLLSKWQPGEKADILKGCITDPSQKWLTMLSWNHNKHTKDRKALYS